MFKWRLFKPNTSTSGTINQNARYNGSIICGPIFVNSNILGTFENPLVGYHNEKYVTHGIGTYTSHTQRVNGYYTENNYAQYIDYYYSRSDVPPYDGGVVRNNTYGLGYLIGFDDSDITIVNDTMPYTDIENSSISGRYKVNSYFLNLLISSIAFPIKGALYNEDGSFISNFDYIGTKNISYVPSTNNNSVPCYCDSTTITNNSTEDFFINIPYNCVIDFGTIPQNVPKIFKDWVDENLEFLYPNTYTIYNFDGSEVLAKFSNKPNIVSINFNSIGNRRYLTILGDNGVYYTEEWDSEEIEGKVFRGLSYYKNNTIPNITIGEKNVEWNSSLSLYESYSVYRPLTENFELNLYQNSSEANRVDKTNYLTQLGTINGVLRETTSITEPVITLEMETVPTFNYVYIPTFDRYYFVTEINSIRYNLWEISLSVDVLMTYKDALFNLYAFVDRNENTTNPMLIDKKRVIEQGVDIENVEIENIVFRNPAENDSDIDIMFVLNGYKIDSVPEL